MRRDEDVGERKQAIIGPGGFFIVGIDGDTLDSLIIKSKQKRFVVNKFSPRDVDEEGLALDLADIAHVHHATRCFG